MSVDLMKTLGFKPRTGSVLKCPVCNKEFYRKPFQVAKSKFCSRACKQSGTIKIKCICAQCSIEYTAYPSYIRARGTKYCSVKCRAKWISINRKGEKSPSWRGGTSKPLRRFRNCAEFREWRKQVFARDNWTCQECGVKGGYLHPHHIKSFTHYPETRYTVSNGKTLCRECHYTHHKKYGFNRSKLDNKREVE